MSDFTGDIGYATVSRYDERLETILGELYDRIKYLEDYKIIYERIDDTGTTLGEFIEDMIKIIQELRDCAGPDTELEDRIEQLEYRLDILTGDTIE